MHAEFLLDYVKWMLNAFPYNSRSGYQDVNSHYEVLTVEAMVDAATFCKRMFKPMLTPTSLVLRF